MRKYLTFVRRFILITLLCCMISACNRVSQANFDKIKPNMSMQDVTTILGEPTSSDSITIGGLSGTSAVWKDGKREIVIQFLNGNVFFKTFTNDGEQQKQ